MANMCSQLIVEGSDGTRPLELLEREITELASRIHAATCRWLELVAEYDAREGWAQWGCRSCAHWVSWRCGIAPGPAREHVRVARRLRELPLVRAAFADGELSFSKVRALTRVENVEREKELVDLARHATASQLERLLRAYRGVVAAQRVAAGGRAERWLVVEHDDDGSVLVRGRLPAEEGAVVVAALEAARDQLARQDVPAGTPDGSSDGHVPAGTPEPGRDVPAGTRDGSSDPGVPAGMRDGSSDPRVSAGTPDGSCESDVSAGTRDGSSGRDVPAGTRRISAGEARADALLALADGYLAGARGERTGGDRYQVLVHVDTATLAGTDPAGRCEFDHGAPLATQTARRLACDASLVKLLEADGAPLSIGRKARTIPPALRRALHSRDRGCRFPGCGSRRFVDAHHIEHWADGGPTDLDNLVQLCSAHHRLLHEGGYRIRRQRGGTISFHRPDGRRIPDCPRPPRAGARLHRTRRPDACVPRSHDRLDLALAVDAMLTIAPPDSEEPPGV
jgi:Domain of unknown function (DUF222)/HNH endonuclease